MTLTRLNRLGESDPGGGLAVCYADGKAQCSTARLPRGWLPVPSIWDSPIGPVRRFLGDEHVFIIVLPLDEFNSTEEDHIAEMFPEMQIERFATKRGRLEDTPMRPEPKSPMSLDLEIPPVRHSGR